MSKHTPGPWVYDKAKWTASQWGCLPNPYRGEPDCAGGVLPRVAYFPCEGNDEQDIAIRARRPELQGHAVSDAEHWANIDLITAAPGLLAACQAAVRAITASCHPDYDEGHCTCCDGTNSCFDCTLVELRTAIAEAGVLPKP